MNTFVFFSNIRKLGGLQSNHKICFFRNYCCSHKLLFSQKNQIIYFGVIFEYFSIYLYMLFFLRRLIKSKNDYNYLVLCPHVGNHVKDTGNSIS